MLGVLVLTALWALWFQLSLPGKLPSEKDYLEVKAVLEQQAQPGDVVLLHPWWTERARLFVPQKLPVVGYQGCEEDPLTAHPRVWLLSQPSLPRADRSGFDERFLPGRSLSGAPSRIGPLELSLFDNGRHRPSLFSATEALAKARVFLEGPAGSVPCSFDGVAHRCARGLRVAAEWHEVKFAPRRCLWMQPPGGEQRLVVEFSEVPPGELSLEAGMTWDRGFFKGPQFSTLRAGVDLPSGERLVDLALPPGLEGMQRQTRVTTGGTLRLWTQAASAESRDVCVELFVYPERP